MGPGWGSGTLLLVIDPICCPYWS